MLVLFCELTLRVRELVILHRKQYKKTIQAQKAVIVKLLLVYLKAVLRKLHNTY